MMTRTDLEFPPLAASAPADSRSKPSLAIAIATVCGIGYIPLGPGTWGSVVGIALYYFLCRQSGLALAAVPRHILVSPPLALSLVTAAIALLGVWAADRTAKFLRTKDPQSVVIDEVSGQFLTYVAALAPLNWKYLLLGFILFRAFDIWKPFPARQAESLPGGWGIMADDWMAAIYAAIGLWIARAAGL
jgi:phosphatidylglycerophosphatase A